MSTDLEYKSLADKRTYPWIYERTIPFENTNNINPFNYVQIPMHVLYKTIVDDGIGGSNVTEFSYQDALAHRAAKGLLGFKKVISKNNITGLTSTTENGFNFQFATAFPIRQTKKTTLSNSLLSEVSIDNSFVNLSTSTNPFNKTFLQQITKTTSIDYLTSKAIEDTYVYDNFGNSVTTTSKKGYGSYYYIEPVETTVTSSTYGIHNTNMPLKPDNIIVNYTRTGSPTISKTNTFIYDNLGRLITQTDFVGLPKATTKTNTYNNYGNVIMNVKSVTGLTSITNSNTYDTKGRFILQKQIMAGTEFQAESFLIDSKWGVVISNTSSDCLTKTFEYDVLGRLNKTTFPNGNVLTKINTWQINGNKLFYVTDHYSLGGSPDKKVYVDKWGKIWKEEIASFFAESLPIESFGQKYHTVLTTYDNRGNIKTKTNSFFPTVETPKITTNNYDVYNRLSSVTNYAGSMFYDYSYELNGKRKIMATNTDGNTTAQIIDAADRIVTTTDNGGTLNFTYNSIGNQISVNNNGIEVVSSIYDVYGNQNSMTDVNAGTTNYLYDNYNRLVSQTDANGNNYTFTYDGLGRILTKAGTEGTTTYEYYKDLASNCSNNNLQKIIGFNGVTKNYSYDALKRLTSITETGVSGNVTSRTTSYLYYANSLLAGTVFPSGVGVFNTYDANGYLIKKGTSLKPLATALFYDPVIDGEGRYTSYTLGNGKITTKTYSNDFPASTSTPAVQNLSYNFQVNSGNLLQRNDVLNAQVENFTYDNLNRLKTSTVNGLTQATYNYDGSINNTTGNITTKTDAGYYTYLNTKKNAVAFVTATPTGSQVAVTPIPISTISQSEQLITYTSFLKPASIDEGGAYGGPTTNFEYGPDYERIQTTTYLGRQAPERRYFAKEYEEQKKGTVLDRSIVYVNTDAGLCAILVKENGVVSQYFTYTDYLGSILTVTNKFGTVIASKNFDAWGRERNPTNWNSYALTYTNPSWLYRGYTGHEMLEGFTLINMNGRLYDPVLGRMLSPDNFVQSPYSTQNYNRYSYCLNNPLKYTDPSGNLFIIDSWVIGFFRGLFSGGNAWREANNSAKNDARIWGGLFVSDPNKSFFGRVWEVVSRFTWQLPQTALGFSFSQVRNTLGAVERVDYAFGATVVQGRNRGILFGNAADGVTLGSYINGNNTIRAEASNSLFQHEYGHYIQSQSSGLFYMTKYALPSLFSKASNHNNHPAEQDANVRALRYFNNIQPGFTGWDNRNNSINGYDPTLGFNNASNQNALNNGISRLTLLDAVFFLISPTSSVIFNVISQRAKQ